MLWPILDAEKYPFEDADLDEVYEKYLEFLNAQEHTEKLRLISTFIAREFSKKVKDGDDHEYKISAAVSERILDNGICGIIYPSVQTEYQGFNIVLPPYVVDENLLLDQSILVQLHIEGKEVGFAQHKHAEIVYPNDRFPLIYKQMGIDFRLGYEELSPNVEH